MSFPELNLPIFLEQEAQTAATITASPKHSRAATSDPALHFYEQDTHLNSDAFRTTILEATSLSALLSIPPLLSTTSLADTTQATARWNALEMDQERNALRGASSRLPSRNLSPTAFDLPLMFDVGSILLEDLSLPTGSLAALSASDAEQLRGPVTLFPMLPGDHRLIAPGFRADSAARERMPDDRERIVPWLPDLGSLGAGVSFIPTGSFSSAAGQDAFPAWLYPGGLPGASNDPLVNGDVPLPAKPQRHRHGADEQPVLLLGDSPLPVKRQPDMLARERPLTLLRDAQLEWMPYLGSMQFEGLSAAVGSFGSTPDVAEIQQWVALDRVPVAEGNDLLGEIPTWRRDPDILSREQPFVGEHAQLELLLEHA
eukprot:6211088-Pleurochrysis_carterae.AAC.1